MIVSLKCPGCGANMDVDDSRDFCFCSYCGYKIVNMKEKVEISGAVKIDNSQAIQSLLIRAQQLENSGNVSEAVACYNRVLEMSPHDATAVNAMNRLNTVITEPNVTIQFVSEANPVAVLRVESGKFKTVVNNGGTMAITLPIGNNVIKLKGKKGYKREIYIADRTTKVKILYTEGKHVNRIDIF